MPIGLKIEERRRKILSILAREGQVRVSQLSRDLDVTVVTIRNDLAALERDGYLCRTQGGAVQSVKNFFNFDFQQRRQSRIEEKKAIAALAADRVMDGETLMINSGTTTYFTAMELKRKRNLNILTNSISVAVDLGMVPTFRVILLGGEVNAQYSFMHGEDAQEQIRKYKADKAILSMDGISAQAGITTYHAEEAPIIKLMIERARCAMIVADSSKADHESFAKVCDINNMDYWITDGGADENKLNAIAEKGIKIIKCKMDY